MLTFAGLHRLVGRSFRTRRLRRLALTFDLTDESLVLDLGGSEYYWDWASVLPRVIVANPEPRDLRPGRLAWVQADGRQLPFTDGAFDVVHCNSVLEHLPDEPSRRALAREIVRVGRGYSVQVPNRWFPIEPHTLTPGFHFLPKRLQARLARNFTLWGWLQRPGRDEARGFVESIHPLSARDLRRLFPEARIERERVLGLTKSVLAVGLHDARQVSD